MSEDFRLEVRAHPGLLAMVRAALRAYLKAHDLPEGRLGEWVLAVDEACTNCIRHAYAGDASRTYILSAAADEDRVRIRVEDYGRPCPAHLRVRQETDPPSADQVQPGGLGIQLMHRVFDEVRFATGHDGGNQVDLVIQRK